MRVLTPILALLCLILQVRAVLASDIPDVLVTKFGTYVAQSWSSEPDKQSPTGTHYHSAGHVFTDITHEICLRLGVSFGFELRLAQPSAGKSFRLKVALDHPLMVDTNGKTWRHEEHEYNLTDEGLLIGVIAITPNGLVPGDETWTVTCQGVVVARQTFHVHTECDVPIS